MFTSGEAPYRRVHFPSGKNQVTNQTLRMLFQGRAIALGASLMLLLVAGCSSSSGEADATATPGDTPAKTAAAGGPTGAPRAVKPKVHFQSAATMPQNGQGPGGAGPAPRAAMVPPVQGAKAAQAQ